MVRDSAPLGSRVHLFSANLDLRSVHLDGLVERLFTFEYRITSFMFRSSMCIFLQLMNYALWVSFPMDHLGIFTTITGGVLGAVRNFPDKTFSVNRVGENYGTDKNWLRMSILVLTTITYFICTSRIFPMKFENSLRLSLLDDVLWLRRDACEFWK